MITLRLTPLKHLKILALPLLLNIAFFCTLIYLTPTNINLAFLIFVPCFLVLTGPALYVHYSYYKINGGLVFTINNEGIIKEHGGVKTFYNQIDFKEIKFNMTRRRIAGISKSFVDNYFFSRIIMNNGEEIIISSLYSTKLDQILKENFKNVTLTPINDFIPTLYGTFPNTEE